MIGVASMTVSGVVGSAGDRGREMRTALIIFAGFLVWGVCVGAAKMSANPSRAVGTATIAFVVVWFGVAAVNMYFGVARAGYAFREELPIFLVIFLVPAIVAVVGSRWLR
jgi:hypothetical protein